MVAYLGFRLAARVHQARGARWRAERHPVGLPGRARVSTRRTCRGWSARCGVGERVRPYLFYDVAVSICSTCYRKVEGKIVFQDGRVYMLKRCPEHGGERVLIADDVDYYRTLPRGVHQAARDAAALQHAGALGLPLRLRPVHRPRAALVPDAGRDHRRTATCAARSATPTAARTRPAVPQPRARSSACSTPSCATRASRTSCRSPAASRRSTREFFAILDAAKARADPAPDGQHQRHPHRAATRRSPSGWPSYMPGFEVYLQFDSFERERADASCAAPTCATSASRRSSG